MDPYQGYSPCGNLPQMIGIRRPARETIVKQTKILLAVDSPLLRELLRERIENEGGVEVVEQSPDSIDLLVAVGQTGADVVIQTWPENGEIPSICSHLFLEYPDLEIVGLLEDSDKAIVCRQTIVQTELPAVGIEDLFSAILRPLAEAM